MSAGLPRTVENSPTRTHPHSSTSNDPYVDSLVPALNSLGLSPISASDIPKATTDYLKFQYCPQDLDPQSSPRAILDAYRNLMQYPLSDILARVMLNRVVVPKTCPQPSADLRDALNLSMDAIWVLKEHLKALPPTSPAWKEPLMEKIVDKMIVFIQFYVREIVATNRTAAFQAAAGHDFQWNVFLILGALRPFNMQDSSRLWHTFLADILPPLLLTYPSVDPSEHKHAVLLAFHFIQSLQTREDCRNTLYANFFRLLEHTPSANDTLASAFIIAVNSYRDTLLSPDAKPVETTCNSIIFTYHLLGTFMEKDASCTALIKSGLTSATCDQKERSKTGRLTGLPSRRDIYFMNGLACMTLARHAPFARNAAPADFVRHMDFTQSPPALTLKSLGDPIYNESTRIVIGEDEIMDSAARSQALSFMRATGQVGVVYYRKFPPGDSFNEVALTFLDWTVGADGRLLYIPVNLDRFDPSK